MSNITGGELGFELSIDPEALKKGLTDAEGKLMGFSEIAELTGEKLDNALKGDVVQNLKDIGLQSNLTGKDMKNAIKDAEEFVKGMEIGLKDVLSYQKELYNEIQKLPAGDAQATLLAEYNEIGEVVQNVSDTIEQSKNTIQSFKDENASLATKLRLVKEEMQQLIQLGQQDSEKYRDLSQKAKEYTDDIQQLNAKMKAINGNPGLDLFVNTLGLASGAFATAQGAMGLFIGKNEDLDAVMVRLQSTMSVAIGLQQLQNSLKTEGGVISGIMAVQEIARGRATDIGTAATGRAALAQKAWNLVANANPYVLLATAIITVVGAIALYVAATSEAEKKSEDLAKINQSLADSLAEPLVAYKTLQSQWNSLGDDLKAKEKFITDNKDEFAKLGVEVINVKDAENVLVNGSVAFVEAMQLRAEAAANAQVAVETYKEALLERSKATEKLSNPTIGQNIVQSFNAIRGKSVEDEIIDAYSDSNDKKNRAEKFIKNQQELLKKAEEIEKNNGFVRSGGSTKKTTKTTKSSTKNTSKSSADEFLPEGSIAEIQKRLSQIDDLLSKATDSTKIEALKNKRISTAAELAEAIKKIEVKSLEDRAAEQEKYRIAYEVIAETQGKEVADKLYGPLIEGSGSQIAWLEKEKKALEEKQKVGILSQQEREDLVFANEKLNEYANIKLKPERWQNELTNSLRGVESLTEQIDVIQSKIDELAVSDGTSQSFAIFNKDAEKQIENLKNQQKENYAQFLKDHQSFEEKREVITKKYAELRKIASKSVADTEKLNNAEAAEQLELFFQQMQNNPEYAKMFTDMNSVATKKLQEFREILVGKLNETKNEADKIKIGEFIQKIDEAVIKRNPGVAIIKMFKAIGDSALSTQEKIAAVQNGISGLNDYLKYAGEIASGVESIFVSLGGSMDSAVGDMINSVKQGIEGFQEFTEGASQAIQGFSSGNIIQGVAGAVKAIGGLVKTVSAFFNGDKKKERSIKKQAAELKELEAAYNALAYAAEKAFGSQKYDGQRDLIKNLEQQKAAIQGLLATEQSKKKADNEKISGYQSQIQAINQSIESLKDGILKDVLQTDIPEMASKIGDALLEAFGEGENGVKAVGDAFDDMVKNILKNQLNKVLETQMAGVYKNILKAAGFNEDGSGTFDGLTPQEIADLKAQVLAASTQGQQFIDAYASIFEGLDSNSEGLKGDIKGITEKTAGALESQINAIRIYQAEGLNISKANQLNFVKCLQNLVLIEFNTRSLIPMQKDIAEMNSKMKKNLVGFP